MATLAYYPVFVIVHLFVAAMHPTSANAVTSKSSHGETTMASLRRLSRQVNRGNGNGIIDEALPMWKTWLQENGYDPLTVKAYDFQIDSVLAKLSDCYIVGLSTLRRTGDVTVNVTESAFAATANVGLEKLTAKCKVQIRWSLLRGYGTLTASVEDFSIEASVLQIRPPPRFTALVITDEGNIGVEFVGDGIVGTILQWISQGFLKYKLQQTLKDTDRLIALANESVGDVDVENVLEVF